MSVFLSWSGPVSRDLADVLREYLPCLLQGLELFMSQRDLPSGTRWGEQVAVELAQASFGILCLTPDNLTSEWIIFEAGAITKQLEGRACGLLFNGLKHSDITGPLAQFHNRIFSRPDMYSLVQDINKTQTRPLAGNQLELIFNTWWPHLEQECSGVLSKVSETHPDREPPDRDEPPTPQDFALLKTKVASLEKIVMNFVESLRVLGDTASNTPRASTKGRKR